ncbi:MAG: N-acetylmuramoyl-L-alanine amidase [Candidatus Dadabacteria bacterium]|nr:N-acetylmuramoyl-L-alanine amidase [Candidatus Dadabacteria bacterium]
MTRETNDVDISNVERTEIANRANANLFVRIHADRFPDPNINGVSIFYPGKNRWTEGIHIESKKAAQLVSDELLITTGAKKNRIKPRVDISGFNWSRVPVILVEVGYLTNPSDDELLNTDEYQWKVAQGIRNGILRFLQD